MVLRKKVSLLFWHVNIILQGKRTKQPLTVPAEWLEDVVIVVEHEDGLDERVTVRLRLVGQVQTQGWQDLRCKVTQLVRNETFQTKQYEKQLKKY